MCLVGLSRSRNFFCTLFPGVQGQARRTSWDVVRDVVCSCGLGVSWALVTVLCGVLLCQVLLFALRSRLTLLPLREMWVVGGAGCCVDPFLVFTVDLAVTCIVCCTIVVAESLCNGGRRTGDGRRIFSVDGVARRRTTMTIGRDSNNFDITSGRCSADFRSNASCSRNCNVKARGGKVDSCSPRASSSNERSSISRSRKGSIGRRGPGGATRSLRRGVSKRVRSASPV